MRKTIIILAVIVSILFLSACSSKEKTTTGDLEVTENNKSYIGKYDKSLQGFIEEMSAILITFNDALDGLYTQEYSEDQFAQAVKGTIEKSNQLVKDVESVDVKPELFEANQKLIELTNQSHQLLLKAIDMANNEDIEIDKESLRNEYMTIKTNQAIIANEWKILRSELEAGQEN